MAANRQRRSLTERGQFWKRHLQRWRQSGLSQAEYCRRRQISAPAFGWWKGRLSAANEVSEPVTGPDESADLSSGFVEVAVNGPGGTGGGGDWPYEIVLANHRCLRLGRGFESEQVRHLLALLESQC